MTGRLEHFGVPGDLRVWVRIANTLLDRIASGEYAGRLPSGHGIVAEFSVSPATGRKVLRALAARDLAYRVGNVGYYVQAGEHGTDSRPPSVRVTEALLGRIASGDLKPWQAVPPIEALRSEHGCSRRPVTAALANLECCGVIRRVPGGGYQVMPDGADAAAGPDLRSWARIERALLELAPGALVPSRAVLAREYQVSPSTVMRALGSLRERGVIRRIPGGGYEVIPPGDRPPSSEEAAARQKLIEALQWMWAGVYEISEIAGGKLLEAWRMDGSGTLYADAPEGLRDAIREDYGLRPVVMP